MLTHPLIRPPPPLLSPYLFPHPPPIHLHTHTHTHPTRRTQQSKFNTLAVDQSQTDAAVVVSTTDDQEGKGDDFDVPSAADVVRRFYKGINLRDLSAVVDLIAVDCVYEDLVFAKPFVGRKAILEFFDKFMNTISKDLQFGIDDISNEDSSAVGVTWHLEWKGKEFPFSKGCSFYRLEVKEGKRQIIYGRDIVEPFIKPGDAALTAIRGVTWLLERFPQLAERM